MGRGEATPPSPAPPSPAPPQTPSSAAPQPGPPVAQPVSATPQSMLQQRGLGQPPTLASPDLTAQNQQIMQKYGLNTPPPARTGNVAQDTRNLATYKAWMAEQNRMAQAEMNSAKTEAGANARTQYQQQSEMFNLKKASAMAKERQIEQERSSTLTEQRQTREKATAPMEDKDLNETMNNFNTKDIPPRMVSAVRSTQRFNKGMDPNDVMDTIRGLATNQYRLDDKVKPETINDEHGLRYKIGYVRSDGSRGHITMPEDEFDNMMTQKKASSMAAQRQQTPIPGPTAPPPPKETWELPSNLPSAGVIPGQPW